MFKFPGVLALFILAGLWLLLLAAYLITRQLILAGLLIGMILSPVILAAAVTGPVRRARQERDQARALALQAGQEKERVVHEQKMVVAAQVEDRTAELSRARDAAEAANRAKSLFLAQMSHDLHTPLNTILGYIQLLKQDPSLLPLHRQQAEIIEQNGYHLLGLIREVLDLARIEAGQVTFQPVRLDLAGFLQAITELIRPEAQKKGLAFQMEPAAGLPSLVLVDEKRLRQVLVNLLATAVKTAASGQLTFRVEATPVEPAPGPDGPGQAVTRLQFFAADTPGLDSDFKPAYPADSDELQVKGAGLGLAISQRLAGLMGGRMGVISRPGQGSIFCLEIELPLAAPPPVVPPADPAIIGYEGGPYTLLIVDDIASNRAVFRNALAPLGFTVLEAADGQGGLELARQACPHLIMTDLRLPVLDGLEMTRLIRQGETCPDVPILGVSTSAREDDRQRFLEAGGSDFLPKPVRLDSLLPLLQALLPLEWVYRASGAGPTSPDPRPLPPPAELARLGYLAGIGDIEGLRACLDEIERLDETYRPFTAQIHSLVDGYQLADIQALLRSYP